MTKEQFDALPEKILRKEPLTEEELAAFLRIVALTMRDWETIIDKLKKALSESDQT